MRRRIRFPDRCGTVVSKVGDELVLDTGAGTIGVDMSDAPTRPTADPGDRITVYGKMDDIDPFEGRELEADFAVVLSQS